MIGLKSKYDVLPGLASSSKTAVFTKKLQGRFFVAGVSGSLERHFECQENERLLKSVALIQDRKLHMKFEIEKNKLLTLEKHWEDTCNRRTLEHSASKTIQKIMKEFMLRLKIKRVLQLLDFLNHVFEKRAISSAGCALRAIKRSLTHFVHRKRLKKKIFARNIWNKIKAIAVQNATAAVVDRHLAEAARQNQAHSGIISDSTDEVKFFVTEWDDMSLASSVKSNGNKSSHHHRKKSTSSRNRLGHRSRPPSSPAPSPSSSKRRTSISAPASTTKPALSRGYLDNELELKSALASSPRRESAASINELYSVDMTPLPMKPTLTAFSSQRPCTTSAIDLACLRMSPEVATINRQDIIDCLEDFAKSEECIVSTGRRYFDNEGENDDGSVTSDNSTSSGALSEGSGDLSNQSATTYTAKTKSSRNRLLKREKSINCMDIDIKEALRLEREDRERETEERRRLIREAKELERLAKQSSVTMDKAAMERLLLEERERRGRIIKLQREKEDIAVRVAKIREGKKRQAAIEEAEKIRAAEEMKLMRHEDIVSRVLRKHLEAAARRATRKSSKGINLLATSASSSAVIPSPIALSQLIIERVRSKEFRQRLDSFKSKYGPSKTMKKCVSQPLPILPALESICLSRAIHTGDGNNIGDGGDTCNRSDDGVTASSVSSSRPISQNDGWTKMWQYESASDPDLGMDFRLPSPSVVNAFLETKHQLCSLNEKCYLPVERTPSCNNLFPCTSDPHGSKSPLTPLSTQVVARADHNSKELVTDYDELLKRELAMMEKVYKHREEVIKRVERVKKESEEKAERERLQEIIKLKRKTELEKTALQLVAKSKRKPLEVRATGRASVKRLVSHSPAHSDRMPIKGSDLRQPYPDQQILDAWNKDNLSEVEDYDKASVAQTLKTIIVRRNEDGEGPSTASNDNLEETDDFDAAISHFSPKYSGTETSSISKVPFNFPGFIRSTTLASLPVTIKEEIAISRQKTHMQIQSRSNDKASKTSPVHKSNSSAHAFKGLSANDISPRERENRKAILLVRAAQDSGLNKEVFSIVNRRKARKAVQLEKSVDDSESGSGHKGQGKVNTLLDMIHKARAKLSESASAEGEDSMVSRNRTYDNNHEAEDKEKRLLRQIINREIKQISTTAQAVNKSIEITATQIINDDTSTTPNPNSNVVGSLSTDPFSTLRKNLDSDNRITKLIDNSVYADVKVDVLAATKEWTNEIARLGPAPTLPMSSTLSQTQATRSLSPVSVMQPIKILQSGKEAPVILSAKSHSQKAANIEPPFPFKESNLLKTTMTQLSRRYESDASSAPVEGCESSSENSATTMRRQLPPLPLSLSISLDCANLSTSGFNTLTGNAMELSDIAQSNPLSTDSGGCNYDESNNFFTMNHQGEQTNLIDSCRNVNCDYTHLKGKTRPYSPSIACAEKTLVEDDHIELDTVSIHDAYARLDSSGGCSSSSRRNRDFQLSTASSSTSRNRGLRQPLAPTKGVNTNTIHDTTASNRKTKILPTQCHLGQSQSTLVSDSGETDGDNINSDDDAEELKIRLDFQLSALDSIMEI